MKILANSYKQWMLERVWRKGKPLALLVGFKLIMPLRRTVYRFLKKLKRDLNWDPAIPLLGSYPKKTIFQKDTGTPVFIAAPFTIIRIWKQTKCPSREKWIKKKWYIYTMEYYSVIKRNEIGSFVEMWMDLETFIQSELSQKKKNKYHILMDICGIRKNCHRWSYL